MLAGALAKLPAIMVGLRSANKGLSAMLEDVLAAPAEVELWEFDDVVVIVVRVCKELEDVDKDEDELIWGTGGVVVAPVVVTLIVEGPEEANSVSDEPV